MDGIRVSTLEVPLFQMVVSEIISISTVGTSVLGCERDRLKAVETQFLQAARYVRRARRACLLYVPIRTALFLSYTYDTAVVTQVCKLYGSKSSAHVLCGIPGEGCRSLTCSL